MPDNQKRRIIKLDIAKIQELLQEAKLDGWLFTDFQGHDFITKSFLNLEIVSVQEGCSI